MRGRASYKRLGVTQQSGQLREAPKFVWLVITDSYSANVAWAFVNKEFELVFCLQVALPKVPNSVRDQAGSGPNTPHSTPQRPRRASSADGRRDPSTPQLPGGKPPAREPQDPGTRASHYQQPHVAGTRPQSGEFARVGRGDHYQRPGSGDYGTPPGMAPQQQRGRVSGSPAPQQAPPPQPVYAVPQIQPQTVLHADLTNQYASLQHVVQQAPPPHSQYMQLPMVNTTPQHGVGGKQAGAHFRIGNPDSDEDDPNWPPPPPPEYMTLEDAVTGSSSTDKTDSALNGQRQQQHRGSVQDSHASIIQSLNQKFAVRQQSQPHHASLPLESTTTSKSGSSRPDSQSSDDITPTAENQSDGSMLNQIQRGVKLRKTVSNDRSAPKFT